MPVRDRLIAQVEVRGRCLEWIGSRAKDGYGRAVIMGRRWNTHRLSWTLHHGPIPPGLVVRHTCDNPACVWIGHLKLGTQQENIQDRDRKGRGKVPIRAGNGWTGQVMHSSRRRRATLACLAALALRILLSPPASAQLVPLVDGAGLYESGNAIPPDHLAAGWVALAEATPVNGTIALLCTGMSNARQEFGVSGQASPLVFANKIEALPGIRPELRAPGGCQDSMTSPVWANPTHPIYSIANSIIGGAGVQNSQVRAAFHKLVYPDPAQDFASLEAYTQGLAEIGADVVRSVRANFPNVEIIWLQSRSYGGFAVGTLNPEPYAHASGLAAKRLIQAQIDQRRTGVVDPRYGDLLTDAPWIGWGPYFWAGETPRSDGLVYVRSDFMADGVHPTSAGVDKISGEMVEWCVDDPLCSTLALPESGPVPALMAGALAVLALNRRFRAGREG